MHAELPKLRHIRLDLTMPWWVDEDTDIGGVAGMIQGTNVEKVEVNFTTHMILQALDMVRLGEDAKAQLEARAALDGKSVPVSTTFRDLEAQRN